MQTGKINVQTENIFPIIKKFLYSDHEIFVRELVSNAVDATQKLKTLASFGEFKGEMGETTIEVVLNKEAKTLTIKDKGIGMTAEEVDKYINQIAFSGAEEFVNKYKDKAEAANAMIGKFGLGFYSSFMVSAKVEIISKSFKNDDDAKAVHWECDGSPDFTLIAADKTERGTDIVLHIADDSAEFIEKERIGTILRKYCGFLPVEIKFEGEVVNDTTPLWTKKPADLTDEDYKKFYQDLYPYSEDPLFNIHLNVDYPFNLTGILYFPKHRNNFDPHKNKIQLYSRQVFITDSVEGIVPEFLMLLHGVLDSPDIPLNVSRSYLQSDSNVKKISGHITKKVADKLEELFKKDRTDFEQKWEDVKVFMEYGMLTDEKFYERAVKFYLFKNTEGKYFTMEEYLEKIKHGQTDKDKKTVYLYTNNAVEQHSFIETAKERGYDVLEMSGQLDSHFVNHVEQKLADTMFVRVDSDTIDNLIKKEEAMPSKLTEEQQNQLKPIIESQLGKDKFTIKFESLSEKDQPIIINKPEFMRRMKDMAAMGGMSYMGTMPEIFHLVVNTNHPIISRILLEADAAKQFQLAKQICDLAMLSQNMLKGEELTKFVKRSLELI